MSLRFCLAKCIKDGELSCDFSLRIMNLLNFLLERALETIFTRFLSRDQWMISKRKGVSVAGRTVPVVGRNTELRMDRYLSLLLSHEQRYSEKPFDACYSVNDKTRHDYNQTVHSVQIQNEGYYV